MSPFNFIEVVGKFWSSAGLFVLDPAPDCTGTQADPALKRVQLLYDVGSTPPSCVACETTPSAPTSFVLCFLNSSTLPQKFLPSFKIPQGFTLLSIFRISSEFLGYKPHLISSYFPSMPIRSEENLICCSMFDVLRLPASLRWISSPRLSQNSCRSPNVPPCSIAEAWRHILSTNAAMVTHESPCVHPRWCWPLVKRRLLRTKCTSCRF